MEKGNLHLATVNAWLNDIVIGLVAPLGSDLPKFHKLINEFMDSYRYRTHVIQVTNLLKATNRTEYKNIKKDRWKLLNQKIAWGDLARATVGEYDFLAKYAVSRIAKRRARLRKHHLENRVRGNCWVIHQLKKPAEVHFLRETYGSSFFLIGIHSSNESRAERLKEQFPGHESDISSLMTLDEFGNKKGGRHPGQETRDTFQLADLYLSKKNLRVDLERFFELIFGSPRITPTKHEHFMYLAFSEALRSADLSRQVGAAIVSNEGHLLGLGANDVPCFGGGQYWPGAADQRDQVKAKDSNKEQIKRLATQVAEELITRSSEIKGVIEPSELSNLLNETELKNLTEFGRAVHAEMEAVLNCTRKGVSTMNAEMYCTTFPCHNCAKHIIGAGIKRVYFVEPYPKSLAKNLHSDELFIDHEGIDVKDQVVLRPFLGIGPRRYLDLFSNRLGYGKEREKKAANSIDMREFLPSTAKMRFPCYRAGIEAQEKTIDRAVMKNVAPVPLGPPQAASGAKKEVV